MSRFAFQLIFAVLATVIFPIFAHALTYSVTLLDTPGFDIKAPKRASGTNVVGFAYNKPNTGFLHAMLWPDSGSAVDLTPPGFTNAFIEDVSGDIQVGGGNGPASGNRGHALMWNGTAVNVVDLHPPGYLTSAAHGISGMSVVGEANGHAVLWNDLTPSVIDLHPVGYSTSIAWGVHGSSQFGYGKPATDPDTYHALLWNGSADSVIDLHPAGYTRSFGRDVWGSSQVGSADNHAMLWTGSAASAVDLHPPEFRFSDAYGVAGEYQVGFGTLRNRTSDQHALVWHGTAASVIDLHTFLGGLGPTFTTSLAFGITDNGTTMKPCVGQVWCYIITSPFRESLSPRCRVGLRPAPGGRCGGEGKGTDHQRRHCRRTDLVSRGATPGPFC